MEQEENAREIRDEKNPMDSSLKEGGGNIRRKSVNRQNASTSGNETDQESVSNMGNSGPDREQKDDGEYEDEVVFVLKQSVNN